MLTRKKIYDLDFINENDFDKVVNEIMQYDYYKDYYNTRLPLLITPNVDDVVKFSKPENKFIADNMTRASFILPDGQFIVWSSWLLQNPLKKRLPGSDLFPALWEKIKATDKTILLIAPDERVGELLSQEYAHLHYYVPPFFDENNKAALDAVIENCIQQINTLQPDMVLIGIRFPKQHFIALSAIEHLQTRLIENAASIKMPLFLLLGASFEFYLGIKKRAPKFVRFLGMEWFHRFVQEPRRLFRRFFIEDMAFFGIFWKEIFK